MGLETLKHLKKEIYKFIDIYPDITTSLIILVSIITQLLIGNSWEVLLFSIFIMLLSFIFLLITNILIKNILKTKRPKKYNRSRLFKGSFPSFHSQFSAGEATTFIVIIALYTPEKLLPIAFFSAILFNGLASLIVAWSRISVEMHHKIDAIGGSSLGILVGFLIVYFYSPILWKKTSTNFQLLISLLFFLMVFSLSERQRGNEEKCITKKMIKLR